MRKILNSNNKLLSFLILILSFFLIVPNLPNTLASTEVHEISSLQDLIDASLLSKTEEHRGDTYILTNDITLTEEDQNNIANSEYKAINFGTSDLPFTGTFDGNGHTITGLKYETGLAVTYDTGLFSQTDGATIKNLIIDNALIRADFRGGIVVGYANNTLIENVTVKNSHLAVAAADNVVTLITDGGVRGGVIAGDAFNSVIYNCEGENNAVTNNNTSGVAALAGKGLTLGGLVGISNNTTVEYSRVYGGRVSNSYDVAVGALGGNTLYVGGVIGQMQNSSKVIDCFSTATLYYYCATYVSVGAGNVGHIGGIASKMDGNSNEIIRSHYAGTATSRQYNAALVIPIIQNNVNISGIVDVYDGGSVVNSYFKPSLNPDVNMKVLGNTDTTSSYGPVDDTKYASKEYWQEVNYDFSGTIRRNTNYNSNHTNKWVMDTNLGIPVHGKSIAATLDFPGAGEVAISSSELMNHETTTTNPYYFAVQGFKMHEATTSVEARANNGYKFVSWYQVPNVSAWSLEENHDYFDEVFNNNTPVSNSSTYQNIPIVDNNLFVAYYQARVLFHDYQGNQIDINGNSSTSDTNDWYDYEDRLPDVEPVNRPSSSTARLVGWTTTSNNGEGYSSISSPDLASIKNNNAYYETGDKITKTLDLYPIYVDLTSNAHLVFEGNELDNSSNVSERVGVGHTTLTQDANNNVIISVVGDDNGNLPDGYRFLGWYNEDGIRVSKDMTYTLPSNVDLSEEHTFTARFEYRVNYYVRAYTQGNGNNFTNSELYEVMWVRYNSDFQNIAAPGYIREFISHWGTSHINHGTTDNNSDAYTGNIVAPLDVYSHNYNSTTGNDTLYKVKIDTDFPGSGQIIDHGSSGSLFNLNTANFEFTPISNRYHFLFWTLERTDDNSKHWSYASNPFGTGALTTQTNNIYLGRAFVTADVKFYMKDNTSMTVQRRYETPIFNSQEVHTYKYPYYSNIDVATSTYDSGNIINPVTFGASPTYNEMKPNGYAFLGWVTTTDIEENGNEWNYLYDVSGDNYCTTDIHKATPYLVEDTALVEETMDLYPVYAKYNIETRTNIDDPSSTGVVVPQAPSHILTERQDGTGSVVIIPDLSAIINGTPYRLLSITVSKNGGEEEVIPLNGNNQYSYEIEAGPEYVFTANYEPYLLIYHLNDNDTDIKVKSMGDEVGTMPDPTYDVSNLGNNIVFMGYSKTKPNNGYHLFNGESAYNNSGISKISQNMLVNETMELWPIYVESSININSNIDSYLDNNSISKSDVYALEREDISRLKGVIKDTDVDLYHFMGWYEGYSDDNNPGTLVSTNVNYILSGEEAIENKTLTAVYKRSFEINYYDTDKNILDTIYVRADQFRSFVTNVEDNSGNTVETPIDGTAFTSIYNSINSNEIFNNFNWVKSDGTIVSWDNFKNNNISSDMDLYPKIDRITAYDSSNNSIDVVGSSSKDPDILFASNNGDILASLNTQYNDNTLTIHIEEVNVHPNGDVIVNKDNTLVSLATTVLSEDAEYEETTDNNGNAVFNLYQNVQITKSALTNGRVNDVFIFDIVNRNTNTLVQKVSIKAGETITIKLPYGEYNTLEENNWAWRYAPVDSDFDVNNLSSNNVTITNRETNHLWLDDMRVRKNIFN